MTVNNVARKSNTLLKDGGFVVKNVLTNIDISQSRKQANGSNVVIATKMSGLLAGNLNSKPDFVAETMQFFSKKRVPIVRHVRFAGKYFSANPVRLHIETGRLVRGNVGRNLYLSVLQSSDKAAISQNTKWIEPLDTRRRRVNGATLCLQEIIIRATNVANKADVYRPITSNLLLIFLSYDMKFQMDKHCVVNVTIKRSRRLKV